jgi:hypothetical protein
LLEVVVVVRAFFFVVCVTVFVFPFVLVSCSAGDGDEDNVWVPKEDNFGVVGAAVVCETKSNPGGGCVVDKVGTAVEGGVNCFEVVVPPTSNDRVPDDDDEEEEEMVEDKGGFVVRAFVPPTELDALLDSTAAANEGLL